MTHPVFQKLERVSSLKDRLEKHKQHTCQLEMVMRLVNNESIQCDMITDDIKVCRADCHPTVTRGVL